MSFFTEVSEEQIRRERNKARELRRSHWWQNRITGGVCHYCGARVAPAELTLDHVVPLIRGGRTTRGNCVAACKDCNNRKRYLLPVEWDEYLEQLSQKRSPEDET